MRVATAANKSNCSRKAAKLGCQIVEIQAVLELG